MDMDPDKQETFEVLFQQMPAELRARVWRCLSETDELPILARLMRCSSRIQKDVAKRLYKTLRLTENIYGKVFRGLLYGAKGFSTGTYSKLDWLESTRTIEFYGEFSFGELVERLNPSTDEVFRYLEHIVIEASVFSCLESTHYAGHSNFCFHMLPNIRSVRVDVDAKTITDQDTFGDFLDVLGLDVTEYSSYNGTDSVKLVIYTDCMSDSVPLFTEIKQLHVVYPVDNVLDKHVYARDALAYVERMFLSSRTYHVSFYGLDITGSDHAFSGAKSHEKTEYIKAHAEFKDIQEVPMT